MKAIALNSNAYSRCPTEVLENRCRPRKMVSYDCESISLLQLRISLNPAGSIASPSVLYTAIRFLGREWKRALIASLVVLVPCFWQKHLESCDLPSHTYNIWLIQLVHSGRAPGLY